MTEPIETKSVCACAEHLRAECRGKQLFRNAEGQYYCVWHYPGADTPDPVISTEKFICSCHEEFRSACQTEPFFNRHEDEDYCVLHYPNTDKIESFRAALEKKLDEKDFNFRGVWFPENADFSNASFSADADFSNASFSADADFSNASFSANADFSNASFSAYADFRDASFSAEAYFSNASFSADADFSNASFSAYADFSNASVSANAYFDHACFSAEVIFFYARFNADVDIRIEDADFHAYADFRDASFNANAHFNHACFSANAHFNHACFSANVDFRDASFSAYANFNRTIFTGAYFRYARFTEADFSHARFSGYAHFYGTTETLGANSYLNYEHAEFDKPEQVSFHTLPLRPHWFINVDSRKFEFTDVEWNYRLKDELQSASEKGVNAPHKRLASACRQLADNAEANHRYYEASRFRYDAFEARRIETYRGFVPWRLDWWYWLASGYGESVSRAFVIFLVLLGFFTFGYKRSEFEPVDKAAVTQAAPTHGYPPPTPDPIKLGWREAAVYSINVSILQKPEPRPRGLCGKTLVTLETILGPAQAALLALAVRRRFMR